ncbi:hypothetical protein Vadar_031040 [Vaccinium darrowii]|uniref:Uncharacterized protein n=1 Tax=Vaccinium darrowii TaxID=229202 RepID=A0ACB7XLI8_9ERIC|nr:hypothetical protein Vadar_031040 [Vaccinium darrowii]
MLEAEYLQVYVPSCRLRYGFVIVTSSGRKIRADVASASSNATSGWPTKICVCGAGPCIPTKAGPTAKNPGKYYYKCPVTNPCMQWNGWCDNDKENVSDSADDRTRDFTGMGRTQQELKRTQQELNVDLNKNLRELILAIRNVVRVVFILSLIGIVICVLLVIHLLYRYPFRKSPTHPTASQSVLSLLRGGGVPVVVIVEPVLRRDKDVGNGKDLVGAVEKRVGFLGQDHEVSRSVGVSAVQELFRDFE